MKKRGTILVENIIFIVLNLVFLSILVLFLFSKMTDVAPLEERYAKEIALIIDAAKPGMNISMNLRDLVKKANDEYYNKKIVIIDDNLVTVKISEKSGYSYSFFNDVDFDVLYFYPNEEIFKFEVREKQKEEKEDEKND